MSLLYKPAEEQTVECDVNILPDGRIGLEFSSDCGKFGTDEPLAGWKLTPKRLLEILDDREDVTDEELE